ncbi:MAG: ABC transporter permease [Methanobacteriota archaeon]|nr:MAG: ABC transporter permease [Euryarchaeota archaeon]
MPGSADLAIIPRDPKYQGFRQYQIAQFGLDKTPLEQFVIYLQKLFTLDWGVSYFYKKPVIGILAVDLSWTLLLVGTATIFTVLIGMAIGAYAAVRRGKPFDYLSTGFAIFFYGMPIFWLGLMLQTAFKRRSPFAAWFSWWPQLPVQGYYNNDLIPWQWDWTHVSDAGFHLILPAATLALGTLAGISLVMRSSLIDVMTEDFVTTAKAKGLSEAAVLRRHILPNGLPPMVSLIALDVAFILGGAYQVEYVFNYKGIGYRTIEAIGNLDFPLLQFIIVIGGAAVVIANLISDFVLLLLDPRIKIT